MTLAAVSLDDKYALESGRIYLNGVQALVRLPLMQRQRDRIRGLDTACYVSGYRGSPLGGLDQAFWRASKFTEPNGVVFRAGLNEDLAATAVWGSQQVNMFPGAKVDGVFGMWYGKGPGVDRSGDVFKHANAAGTAPYGGVLAIAGDDHACKSSTLPHQSEYAFVDAGIPVLNPAGIQEILDFGIVGWEMSRYSGCWIGLKTIGETVDSSASVTVDPHCVEIVTPDDFEMPEGGVHIRWPDPPLDQEMRLHRHKIYAALAFARANRLDRVVLDSPNPRFGIVSTGKAYLDVRQALDDLGVDDALAAELGIRIFKVGMSWPLEREGVRQFAEGLDEILVVEEKRALVENQLKEQLYNWREDVRPRVVGKFDEHGQWILPSTGELTPARVARAIAGRISRFHRNEIIERRLAFLDAKEQALSRAVVGIERMPYFCSGCPHNTSTKVPEGSRAMAGIGCHYMAIWMDRNTETFTQMGGEGLPWLGQAPFTETRHVFANLGDGTYFHSGLLAIRAAVASGANITYKILYNDAVAMTGGQPVDGTLTVEQISHQLYGEGIRHIAVVTDETAKYPDKSAFAKGTAIYHRDELERVQRAFQDTDGVTVIIYDQVCAAEKRRRRKRGRMEDPPRRAFINPLVCEGCGDCSIQSNCLSIVPLETEYGRKRAVDQSSCNKDFSCLKGFCPSFVTVEGGSLRKPESTLVTGQWPVLPEPQVPGTESPYGIVVTGIGGTGVVTIGALLGMAAHVEGKGVTVLDMTGLAQKYGSVVSHVRIADRPEQLRAVRVAAGGANLLLGCDSVVAAGFEAISKVDPELSHAVVNSHGSMTAKFIHDPKLEFPAQSIERVILDAVGTAKTSFVDATDLAVQLLGDSIGSNLFMVGYAYQKGLIPVSAAALERAIELNGVAVEFNKQAFTWGRRAAHDLAAVRRLLVPAVPVSKPAESLEAVVERRMDFLTAYQNKAYAGRYRDLVERVRKIEADKARGMCGLAQAVASNYFKLLAIKDEYEVARLFTDGDFQRQLDDQFEGDYTLRLHLAPPLFASRDPVTGHLLKREYGPWLMTVFRMLAKLRFLRGSVLDVFGYSAERQQERQLITDYERAIDTLLNGLDHDNHALATEIASLPDDIRGFGHVKEANIVAVRARQDGLLESYLEPREPRVAA